MVRFTVLAAVLCACGTSSGGGGGAPAGDGGSESAADDASPEEAGGSEAGPVEGGAPESGTDGGADAAPDARDSGGECNTLVNVGAPVPGALVASAPPAAKGGALVDGTYVLTKYQVYTGPGGPSGSTGSSLASTVALAGAAYKAVSNQGMGDARVSGTFTAAGTSFTANVTCPAFDVTTLGYSFDGTTFVQLGSVGANTIEFTYTKQ